MHKVRPAIVTNYLENALSLDKAAKTIRECVRVLKPYRASFDSIAFSGMSGALIAPCVARRLRKQLLLVRKTPEDERRHSPYAVEGNVDTSAYVILDDIICSGNTVRRIIESIQTAQAKRSGRANATCFAAILYARNRIPRLSDPMLEGIRWLSAAPGSAAQTP